MIMPNHVHGTNRPVRAHKGRPHPRDLSHNCPGTVPVPFQTCSTSAPHLYHEIEPSATRWDKMEQFGAVFSKNRPGPLQVGAPICLLALTDRGLESTSPAGQVSL